MVRVFDTLTIDQSSGSIQALSTILGTTDWPLTTGDSGNKHGIVAIEIAGHSAAFLWGNTLAHLDTISQAAYEPLYLEGDARLVESLYLRASADADITGVTCKVFYKFHNART